MAFKKGNPGKPKGAKSERTKQWEALAEDIIGKHAEDFNKKLSVLLKSKDSRKALRGMEMYCNVLEYFKPKQSRVTHSGDKDSPINIIIPPMV